eukprot:COSAG05_NODE_1_length_66591_cov_307.301581_2_plen_79_part_00
MSRPERFWGCETPICEVAQECVGLGGSRHRDRGAVAEVDSLLGQAQVSPPITPFLPLCLLLGAMLVACGAMLCRACLG